jgi:hypothetical protein
VAELLAEKDLVALMPENPIIQVFSGRGGGVNLVIPYIYIVYDIPLGQYIDERYLLKTLWLLITIYMYNFSLLRITYPEAEITQF